ncbi:MAG: helix-turn-helix domain-containing protein [Christensenellales bacterium]|jgi:AraC-like DNA-binding protein
MYPIVLSDDAKPHWTLEEIFRWGVYDWVHSFIQRSYSIGMHTQGFYEINIIVSGNGWHYVEGQRMPTARGDFFVIPPNVRHGYHSTDDLDVFHMLIHPLFMERYGAELYALPFYVKLFAVDPLMRSLGRSAPHMKIGQEDFLAVEDILDRLLPFSRPLDPTQSVYCNANALILIAKLCSLYALSAEGKAFADTSKADESFARSIALMYETYDQPLTIETLSKAAKMSRSAYIILFKQIMGLPPGRFLLALRLKKAKDLLAGSELSMLEISRRTGFYDSAHFCRSFAAQEGISPLAFRRQNRAARSDVTP